MPRQRLGLVFDFQAATRSQRLTLAVFAFVALLHAGAFVALRHLTLPAPATVAAPVLTATLIPLTPEPPAPAPAAPTPTVPKPPPLKPRVQPPAPPKAQPKTAITPPQSEPIPEPPAAAPPAPPVPALPSSPPNPGPAATANTAAAPTGPVEGLTVSCDERKPVYPAQSARMGEEGTVKLRLIISERGMVDKVTVARSSGSPRLDQAAKDAAMTMRCRPPLVNGKPVAAAATKPFTFRLYD